MDTPLENEAGLEELMICPSCHAQNSPLAGYCAACHAPLNATVMLDPIGQIEAQGFAWRQATLGKPKLIVVIGVWLLLFPVVVGFGALAVTEMFGDYPPLGDRLPGLLWSSIVAVFGAVVLYKATTNYRRRSREKPANPAPESTATSGEG